MKIRIQPVAGGHYDFAEFRCDCGRIARIGVGDNNWEEPVDEKGRPTKENPTSERQPRIGPPKCYPLKFDPDDVTCQNCDWKTSCMSHRGIGVPHTNEELERIKSGGLKQ